jgi:hypothetical protein
MTEENEDCIADARAAIKQAIADLKAAGIPVPAALFLASQALAYCDARLTLLEPAPPAKTMTTTTPCKSVTPSCNGQGAAGALR